MCEKCCVCVYYALCTYLVLTSYTRIYECINTQITKQNNTPCAASQQEGARGAAPEVRTLRPVRGGRATERTENAGPWQRRSRNASKALRFRAFAFAHFTREKCLRFEVSQFFNDVCRHVASYFYKMLRFVRQILLLFSYVFFDNHREICSRFER